MDMTIVAIVALFLLSSSSSRKGPAVHPTKPKHNATEAAMVALIRRIAFERGVPEHVALAFAELESGFKPDAEGDLDWPTRRGGELYKRHVLDAARFDENPARDDPSAWHSYGLFGLLAPYWVGAHEHPRALLEPERNATLGVGYIGKLLRRHGFDPYAARLAYVGCGADGSLCSADYVQAVRTRLERAMQKWQGVA
jgi:hypothetical protein